MRIARQYAKTRLAEGAPATASQSTAPLADPANPPETDQEMLKRVQRYLTLGNFKALEREIHEARDAKLRFPGGVWKLAVFYDAVNAPVSGDLSGDAGYQAHIERLKRWAEAYPESATAKIALADTYIAYADLARGTGYANTVTEEGWRLHGERTAMAASILADAAKMKEKDPYWYYVMGQVARGQGWDKQLESALLDAGMAFEPGFYHLYRLHTIFLLPKWYGEPGEAEAFADAISNHVGGKQGKFVYFEIASILTCQCDSDESDIENLSWPKIKEGYAAMQEMYGVSRMKTNRYAHMAYLAGDKAVAAEIFARIGKDWEPSVWHTPAKYGVAATWAGQK